MEKEKKFYVIKCPKCGYEYLPEEIYVSLLSKPTNILRDENGKIVYFTNTSLNPNEEFTCERCGCEFNITCDFKFKSEINTKYDFSEDYKVELK